MKAWSWLPLLILPVPALAVELDFYTYNGFDESVAAFHRLALVISDSGFQMFVLVFASLGVTFGMLKTSYEGFIGGQVNPTAFLVPSIVGIAVFKGLVLSTGTVHVYDPVRNAHEPVSGVPDFIVILAGTLSKIERTMVEITDTASANPYADAAGGINYALIRAALDADLNDRYLEKSMVEYYNFCGTRALGQSTSGDWGQHLMHDSHDLLDDFSNWTNGVLSVVYYPPGNDQGEVRSCTGAWAALRARLSDPATFDRYLDSVCRSVGMNPSDAAQRARCQDLLAQTTTLYNVATPGVLPYLRSIVLAKSISEATNSVDFSRGQRELVDRQVMAEAFGTSEAMNQWVPRLRSYMVATVLGLAPMTFLFLVTPLFRPAVGLVVGLFAWLALWGTCDAIAIQMSMDAAADAFDQIREQHYGVEAILQSPEAAVQALGVFGKARLVALTLATALSAALFKFGGYAFAQLGQQWQSHFEQAGEAAGRTTLHPEAQASLQRSLLGSAGPQASLAMSGFQSASIGNAAQDVATAAFGDAYVDASVTGSSMGSIARQTAARTLGQNIGQNRASEQFSGDDAHITGAIAQTTAADTARSLGRSASERRLDTTLFGSPRQAGELDAGHVVTSRVALDEQIQRQAGTHQVTPDAVSDVARVLNATSIAATTLFSPEAAEEMAIVQQTENFARADELGTAGAERAGRGGAIDAQASGAAAIQLRDAVGAARLVDANQSGRIAGLASAQNQRAGAVAFGGNGRTIVGRIDYERSANANRTVFIGEADKEDFLRHHTHLNDDQIARLSTQHGGLIVNGAFDPEHPDLGIQVGDFSVQTSARAGSSYSFIEGGEDRFGDARVLQNGQLSIADPTALMSAGAIGIYKQLFQFNDTHPAGALDDQTRLSLATSFAKLVELRGFSGTAFDQEVSSGQLSLDARLGTGGSSGRGPGRPAGPQAAVGGGAGLTHSEGGSVNEQFVVSELRKKITENFLNAQGTAVKLFGPSETWSELEKSRAQEVIAASFHYEMLNSEEQLTGRLREESAAASYWQRKDLESDEPERVLTRKIIGYIDDFLR